MREIDGNGRVALAHDDIKCWVCILLNIKTHKQTIIFTVDLFTVFEDVNDDIVFFIYVREFSNLMDGIACKFLLQNLSDKSLESIITRDNPKKEDLVGSLMLGNK